MKYFFTKRCFQKRKLGVLEVACGLLLSTSHSVIAAPQGGQIVSGQGSIAAPSLTTTQIHQLSNNLVIDWQSFNVSANEMVQFVQPSSTSAVLNQIHDISPSEIFGSIDANGLVFLINPNGILFGEGSHIQVNGLFASNLEMDASRFMSGDFAFESMGMVDGMIVNHGVISASTGGVTLISDTGVVNEGRILATVGSINLAVTTSATLDFTGDGLLQLSVSGDVLDNAQSLDAAITNTGEIIAQGGDVLISGQVARDVFTNVVNNTGVIRATRVLNEGGVITLAGPSGDINNSGTLDVSGSEAGDIVVTAENITHSGLIDASATEGNGGSVTLQSSADTLLEGASIITVNADNGVGGTAHVLGDRVGLFDESQVNASGLTGGGEVLIGGDFQGSNPDIQNAAQTYVGANTSITADAIAEGDGGKVIVWADETTQYYGDISVQGGEASGNGGFVEVSGKNILNFEGTVDTTAVNGLDGTLLLDPLDIIIIDQATAPVPADNLAVSGDNTILFADPDGATSYTISEDTLEGLTGNVILQAQQDIILSDLITDGVLDFTSVGTGSSVVFQAGRHITFNNIANTIQTAGGNIHLEADSQHSSAGAANGTGDLTLGLLNSNGGNITLLAAGGGFNIGGAITAGTGNVSISTSDNTAIDLDADITQAGFDFITTTGALTIGQATTAGTNGLGLDSVIEYASLLTLSIDLTVASNTASLLNLFATGSATNGFIINDQDTLTVNQELVINVGVDSNLDGSIDDYSVGVIEIDGGIVVGANNLSLSAHEIKGDNDNAPIAEDEITATTGSTVTLTGALIGITDKPLNLLGVETLVINDIGAGDIELDFGSGSVADLSVSSNVIDFTTLGDVTDLTYTNTHSSLGIATLVATGANLTINATNGITDNTSVITAQNLTLTADGLDAAIGVSGTGINTTLTGALTATANNGTGGIYINQTGALDVASIATGTGNLELTTTGAITQSGAIAVGGISSITAGANAITLTNAANDFVGAVSISNSAANAVQLTDVNAIDLGTVNVGSGGFTINAGGAISQSGVLTIAGASSFNAGANTIILANAGNDFTGAVSLSNSGAFNVEVTDTNAIDLGVVTTGTGTFIVNAGTDITDSGTQTVNGAATFNVGDAGNITLNDAANAYNSSVTFASSGILGNVTFVDTTAYDVQAGGLTVGGSLDITAAGITQTGGALSVTGISSFTAGANAITLTDATNNFGGAVSLSNSAATAAIVDVDAIDLGTVTVGNLDVTAIGVTQSGTITATGTANFNAGAGVITLTDAANDFGGVVSLSNSGLNDVAVTGISAIQLGAVSVGTGTFTINAGGAITQNSTLTIAGASSFSAGANAITLTDAANNFGGAVSLSNSAATAAIVDVDAIDLGTVTVGNLDVTAVGITQSGVITTTGTASFNAGAGVITLTDAANDFAGAVSLINSAANAVQITDVNAIDLGIINVGDLFTVTAGTNITDSGTQTVTGAASFNVGDGGNITLNDAANAYASTVSFNSSGTLGNVTFVDTTALDLQASTIGGDLNVTGAGITQSGILNVTGTSSFTAGANTIALNLANDFVGAVSLNNSGINAVSITDANAIQLGTVSVGSGSFTVNANGAITQASALTIAGASSFNAGANAITLTNASNDFGGVVSLSNSGLSNVALTDINAIQLGTVSVGTGTFTINAGGAITQNSALTIAGASSFSAGANTITLTNALNDFTGAVSLSNSGTANVAITDANAIDLGVVNVGTGTFIVTAGTDITSSGTQTVGGAATFNVGASGNITLNDASNTYNAGVTFVSAGTLNNVTFLDNTAYNVQAGGLTIGGALNITAAGITQTGDLSVTGASTFNAGSNDITLTNAANNFNSIAITSASNVTLVDGIGGAGIAASSVAGDYSLTSVGSITSSGLLSAANANLLVTGLGNSIGSALTPIAIDLSGNLTATASNGSGGIYISDAGNLAINTINANTGNVELSAVGSITDAAGADTTVDIIANRLTLNATAGAGVSATDALNLQVTRLTIPNSTGGDFFLTEANALLLETVNVGSIDLFANGNLTVIGNVTTSTGDLKLGSAGILAIEQTESSTTGVSYLAGAAVEALVNYPFQGTTDDMWVTPVTYGAVTLNSSAGGNIILESNDIRINVNEPMTYSASFYLSIQDIFDLTYDDYYWGYISPDATLNAGTNAVIFDTYTAANTLTVGTMLTAAEIGRISAAGAVQFGTLDNTGGVQLTSNINTSAFTDTLLITSGAVTSSAAANTLTVDNLSIDAENGIGSAATALRVNSNTISAVNHTSGDIYLSFIGNTTVGGIGQTIDNQVAGGTIGIAATGNLIIANDFTVAGTGTVSLDANGTITRTGGTITANTVNLGTNGTTTAIGAAGTPVIVSSPNITATTTTGDINLQNDQTVNLIMAAGGNAEFVNTTGAINSVTAQAINATGNLTLRADDMEFVTGSTVSGANINLYTQTAAAGFLLGSNVNAADQVELAATELQALSSIGTVTIGENGVNTGDIILGGAVDLSAENFALTLATEGKIDTLSAGNILNLKIGKTLTLDALNIGTTNPVETVASNLNIITNNGAANIVNGNYINYLQINAGTGAVDIRNTGFVNFNTTLTVGSLVLDVDNYIWNQTGGAINASVGDIALTVRSVGGNDGIYLDGGTSFNAASGDLFLTADRMMFDRSGTSTLTGNNIEISPYTNSNSIVIGSNVTGTTDVSYIPMQLNSAELAMLNSAGTVTIGGVGYTGNVNMGQTAVNLSAENFDFTVTTTGTIDDITGTANSLSLNTGHLLTLNAGAGIGNTNAITFTADSVSAINTTSGSLALAPTGNITLGGGANTIEQQAPNGALTVASGGDIIIAADVSVSGGGLSTVSLNAAGTITRTGGTVIGDTINLTAGAVGDSIGVSGTPVITNGNTLNINATGNAYVENISATAAQLAGTTANITFVQSGAGDLALGNLIASGLIDVSTTSSNIYGVAGQTVQANDVAVVSAGSIGVGQTLFIDAANSLSLTTNGAGAAGSISVGSNTAIPLSGLVVNNGNSSTVIGITAPSFTVNSTLGDGTGNLLLNATAGSIALNADLNYLDLYLGATGGITQTTGIITANNLLIRTTNSVTLSGNNDVNNLAANVAGAGQSFTFNDVDDLNLAQITGFTPLPTTAGITTNNGAINLTTGGALTQTALGVVSGGLLTTDTVGGATLNTATNNITSFNGTDTNGDILLTDSGTLNIAGISTTGNVTLSTGSLTQSGLISSNQLTTNTVNGSVLSSLNTVNGYSAINTTSGNVQLNNDITTLTLAGINQSGTGNVIINNTGNIVAGNAIISNAINLTAGGTISQNATGSLTGGVLTTSSAGGTTLGLNNALSGFNATDSAGGNILLIDSGALNVAGINTTGNVDLTTGNLTQSGIINANQLTTNTVNGSVLNSLNTVNSYTATNTTSGNIELNDNVATLTLAGINQSGSGDVIISNTGAIINSGATISNAINLAAGGTITQAGAFTGTLLTTSSIGGTTLSNAANDVAGFNATDTTGDILIVDNNALNIAGISTSGNVSLSTGSLSQSGVISANQLTTNTVNGSVLNSLNIVNSYAATNATSGNIELNDNVATLTLAGINQSGSGDVIISNTGAIINSGATISNAIDLKAGGTITQTATFAGTLLTTTSNGGTTLGLNNALSSFNGSDVSGDILLVDTGSLDITGITTTGNINLTTGSLTQSGAISGNVLTTTTAGGSLLNDAGNSVAAYIASDTAGGSIELANTGALNIDLLTTDASITISSTGDISQTSDIISTAGGDISVTSSAGSITMVNGTNASTTGGTITYEASGDIAVSSLDAAAGTLANVGTVTVISNNGSMISTDFFNPSVRANTVNLTAASNIGLDEINAFVLSSDIQGTVTLIYSANAYITTSPNVNVNLDIVDLGVGLINSGAARSAGTQRSQSSGLEDVGFIDLALFSDINLFVIDGVGIALPDDQSDEPPLPGKEEEKRKKKKADGVQVSVLFN